MTASAATAPSLIVKSYQDFSQAAESEGKFVLLTKGSVLHLIFSPVSLTPYHATIVRHYLENEGLGKVEGVGSTGCRILTRGWNVQGGGYYHLQPWLHLLALHGKSTAFGKYRQTLLEPFSDGLCGRLGLEGYALEMG